MKVDMLSGPMETLPDTGTSVNDRIAARVRSLRASGG